MIEASRNLVLVRPLRPGAPPIPPIGTAILLAMAAAVVGLIAVVHLSRAGLPLAAVDESRMETSGMSAGAG